MESHWGTSKWKASDLSHKQIQFRIPTDKGQIEGVGELWANQNPEGLIAVWIVTDTQGRHWAERVQTVFDMPAEALDRIERHPDPSVADFLIQ